MKNLYDQLDVSIYATNEEIKKAFRKKAKIYHPDANNDEKEAEEKFKEIKNAYDTLIDKDKRAEYDFFLKTINEFHNNVDEWDEYFDKNHLMFIKLLESLKVKLIMESLEELDLMR